MAKVNIASTTDNNTTRRTRKVVRDSSGYYYVAYYNVDDIYLLKSNSTSGFDGTEVAVEIIGTTGVARDADNGDRPDIIIDGNGILKMAYRRLVENECWYTQWDTATDMSTSNNWTHADGSTQGAERLCTDNFGDISRPSMAIDSNNYAHVVWNQVDGAVYEIFYRRWTGVAWSTADTQITNGSAQTTSPYIEIDGNDHVHVVYRYDEADKSIRYAHTEDFTNWYQSDDTTPITTGASGEEIITQASKDCDNPTIAISQEANTLNDIWVLCEEVTDDDMMYAWYDKSGGSWTTNGSLETSGVCREGAVGIDSDGVVWMLYSQDSNIRLAVSSDSGVHWDRSTIETSGDTYLKPMLERNFDTADFFGYIFKDETNDIIYFNTQRTTWGLKSNPYLEQNQPPCQDDIGYVFQNFDENKCLFDVITGTGEDNIAKNPMMEAYGASKKLGYMWADTCEDKGMFDQKELPSTPAGGGGALMVWLNLPGK